LRAYGQQIQRSPAQILFTYRKLDWTPRKLNEIIRGKRNITAATAIDLGLALNTTPEFWLNLQQAWDLNQAYRLRKVS
jgi:addiction module HigA family antidote